MTIDHIFYKGIIRTYPKWLYKETILQSNNKNMTLNFTKEFFRKMAVL